VSCAFRAPPNNRIFFSVVFVVPNATRNKLPEISEDGYSAAALLEIYLKHNVIAL
jgi:hypothetical protein